MNSWLELASTVWSDLRSDIVKSAVKEAVEKEQTAHFANIDLLNLQIERHKKKLSEIEAVAMKFSISPRILEIRSILGKR